MAYIHYALAHLATLVVLACVVVYGFGYVEPQWGQGRSIQVLVFISLLATVVGGSVFGVAGGLRQRTCTGKIAMLCGFITAATGALILFLAQHFGRPLGLMGALLLWCVLAAVATLFLTPQPQESK